MADVMGAERSSLVITLLDNSNESHNITISNPKVDVTETEIKAVAQYIIDNNCLIPKVGAEYVSIVKAKVVATETDTFDLV